MTAIAVPEALEWRPIETAPRDKRVLIANSDSEVWLATLRRVGPRAGIRWEHAGLGRVMFIPTHWMPLPPPPKEKP